MQEHVVSETGNVEQIQKHAQEMNRETNTIGSNACNARIARLVVDMKGELEKIREQVQNIE